MVEIRAEWLRQAVEPAIDPSLPICDAHHHLWRLPERLGIRDYGLDDLCRDIDAPDSPPGHNVVSTVFVECGTSYDDVAGQIRFAGETRFVESIAAAADADPTCDTAVAAAIISRADLSRPDTLPALLDAHVAASPTRFRGVRHSTAWDADPAIPESHTRPRPSMMLDAEFIAGAEILADRGLVFDAWCYFPQIVELVALAQRVPDLQIVLDHVGGIIGVGGYAADPATVFVRWAEAIELAASMPNIVVKLGGLAMDRSGFRWHQRATPPSSDELADATAPYVQHALAAFGPERAMFESNFPMDKRSCSWSVLWNSFMKIVADRSDADRAALFAGTAHRVYGIDADTPSISEDTA